MKVAILGVSGMLGHVLYEELRKKKDLEIFGTIRKQRVHGSGNIIGGIAANSPSLENFLDVQKPDVVINAIGIIKQLKDAHNARKTIEINALFPHKLAEMCEEVGARMIHISTDCVFNGKQGMYLEGDVSNAEDLYGRTKYLGEVAYPHTLTLRTSIIGHELETCNGLIGWFLSQQGRTKGFTKAIYTGFPTVELARIIYEYVLPNKDLNGVFQVSSEPIDKFTLLNIVKEVYGKDIIIEPYDEFFCDRSLDSTRFRDVTGFKPKCWQHMIEEMYEHYKERYCNA